MPTKVPERRLWYWRGTALACLLVLATVIVADSQTLGPWLPLRALIAGLVLVALACALVALISLRAGRQSDAEKSAQVQALESELHQLKAARTKAESRFSALLSAAPDALLLLDAKGRVLEANRPAQELFDRKPVGARLLDLIRAPAVEEAAISTDTDQRSRMLEVTLAGPIERHLEVHIIALDRDLEDNSLTTGANKLLLLRDATALRRAEALRADFVANASHELRTPLASLQGFIETLQGPAAKDATAQTKFLAIMRAEAERMARIINDLLSLSRIELQEHSPPQEVCDLDGVVSRVTSMLAPQAEAREVRLSIQGERGLQVIGSADELVQVLQNLVDNAIKYGRQGGEVVITSQAAVPPGDPVDTPIGELNSEPGPARPKRKGITITVKDDGEGIAQDHLPRLTERFYRVDKGRSRALGGTGLGLAIVKHILNRHRGHLDIVSAPGRGSTFTVYLPDARDFNKK